MVTCSNRAAWCSGVLFALSTIIPAPLIGSELEPRTVQGYEDYVARAKEAFVVRGVASRAAVPLADRGQIKEVPGGLVHHWAGTVFIPGVDLDRVLSVAQNYDDYAVMYGPVLSSRLLAHDNRSFRVFTRLREDAGVLAAVLDVWTVVTYERSGTCAYSLGTAIEIRQVKNAGQQNEERLPAGRDSGYLWRANTLARFTERDGGVYVELETVGLSRRFPPFVSWLVEPVARRLGRASVERTLTEFRNAVLANAQRPIS